MTDTAAPRFTEQDYLRDAAEMEKMVELLDRRGIENAGKKRRLGMLLQAAADLAALPTREELVALIADHFMLGKKYANQYADKFIAAGVKVRHE